MSEMCLVEQASIKLNVLFQLSSVSISTGKISASVHKLGEAAQDCVHESQPAVSR